MSHEEDLVNKIVNYIKSTDNTEESNVPVVIENESSNNPLGLIFMLIIALAIVAVAQSYTETEYPQPVIQQS